MIQKEFAEKTVSVLKTDSNTIGLAVGGSWITGEMDELSDLDLVLITRERISGDKTKMLEYANRFGKLLSAFTGEHVGETRLLICLYDEPLLHVDIKFITPEEFHQRVETPVLLLDKDGQLQKILDQTESKFPYPDYQWVEDRFWIWVHYMLTKIERGEFVEAFDCFGLLRGMIFGPLLHIKNGNLPRGVRKAETQLASTDLEQLKATLPMYSKTDLLKTLQNAVTLYCELRSSLFSSGIILQTETENKVMEYFTKIKSA
jgi:predicted nucleotidyltransferase